MIQEQKTKDELIVKVEGLEIEPIQGVEFDELKDDMQEVRKLINKIVRKSKGNIKTQKRIIHRLLHYVGYAMMELLEDVEKQHGTSSKAYKMMDKIYDIQDDHKSNTRFLLNLLTDETDKVE